jgi:hypothetical protein
LQREHDQDKDDIGLVGGAEHMVTLGVILLIVAAVAIVLGLVLYGNGVGEVPDDIGRNAAATRRGVASVSWKDLFARMKTSVKGMTDPEAGRDQKLTATGAFCVLVGLILVVLAVLALLVNAV